MPLPSSLRLDAASPRVALGPSDPAFVQDPYAAYHAIRAAHPRFFWEDYGFWCFCSHEDVTGLLRDRRFGREILHVATREELGWPEPEPHTAPFHAIEAHSMLEREPPVHTRLRTLVNRAFVSRQVERLRPRIEALAHASIDGFEGRGEAELIEAFATPIPRRGHRRAARRAGARWRRQLLDWSHRMVAMYQFGRSAGGRGLAAAAATGLRRLPARLRRRSGARARRTTSSAISSPPRAPATA